MEWNKLVPELVVRHYSESKLFYQEIFGFTLRFERLEERFGYFDLEGAQIMLLEQPGADIYAMQRPGPNGKGLHFQVEVESIEGILQRLQQAAIPLSKAVYEAWYRGTEVEYGQREFSVCGPDGYLFRFSQCIGERPAQT